VIFKRFENVFKCLVQILPEAFELNVKEAIVSFQYAERIKSGLIVASKLIDEVYRMPENERLGAEKLLISFMSALNGEIKIAYNVSHLQSFMDASLRVEKGVENIRSKKFNEAIRNISQAISLTTTEGQRAIKILEAEKIF